MDVLRQLQERMFRKITVTNISFNWVLIGWSFKNQRFDRSIWSPIGSNDAPDLELSWLHMDTVTIKDHRTWFDVSRKLLKPFWSELQGPEVICSELSPEQSQDLGPVFINDRDIHPLMNGLTNSEVYGDYLGSPARNQFVW